MRSIGNEKLLDPSEAFSGTSVREHPAHSSLWPCAGHPLSNTGDRLPAGLDELSPQEGKNLFQVQESQGLAVTGPLPKALKKSKGVLPGIWEPKKTVPLGPPYTPHRYRLGGCDLGPYRAHCPEERREKERPTMPGGACHLGASAICDSFSDH